MPHRSKLPRRLATLLVAGLLLALAPTATAEERADTETIREDEYAAIQIPFNDGPSLKVEYDVEVTDGPNIDIFVLDNANFQKYKTGDDFESHQVGSDMDTARSVNTFTLDRHATWWIVLDNTNEGGAQPPSNLQNDPATVTWTVKTTVDVQSELEDLPGPGALAIVGALGAAALASVWLRKDP